MESRKWDGWVVRKEKKGFTILTISQTTTFRLFETEKRKFSQRVENTVGKGEIARYEQFLLFTQCFQKTSSTDK